jgi:hypothetical protein
MRGAAAAAEQPDDHTAGERLDHAVDPKADQRDRAGGDAGADRDRELDHMPSVPAPGEHPRPPLEPRPLRRRRTRQAPLQLDSRAHAGTSLASVSSKSRPRSLSE